jgi:hypothetical protein
VSEFAYRLDHVAQLITTLRTASQAPGPALSDISARFSALTDLATEVCVSIMADRAFLQCPDPQLTAVRAQLADAHRDNGELRAAVASLRVERDSVVLDAPAWESLAEERQHALAQAARFDNLVAKHCQITLDLNRRLAEVDAERTRLRLQLRLEEGHTRRAEARVLDLEEALHALSTQKRPSAS